MIDEFFVRQPERAFLENLKKYDTPVINRIPKENDGMVFIENVCVDGGAFSCEKQLSAAFDYLDRLLESNGMKGDSYRLVLSKDEKLSFETYRLEIGERTCTLTAGEVEGARRGIIHFADLLLMGDCNLKKGTVENSFKIECRLARCYFAPINRPPRNLAELNDNEDYYPDAYLERIMRDGANAVWVYADLDQLVKSSYIKEFGEGSEKRIAKLNGLIDKCARYGIKVYLFFIAPMSLDEPTMTQRYEGISEKYPQVKGNKWRGPTGFCTYSEFGSAYLKEAIENLVKSASKLGGIISITFGERVTSCGNTWPNLEGEWGNTCPYCKDKSRMEIVTHTAQIIKDAINNVNPEIDFISWTYGHRGNPLSVIGEYVDKSASDVILLQNFEDDGRVYQLGKKRFALDYYLSYAGPSKMFEFTAQKAKENNKKIYAKIQACCSHELASVPYIPVPGLIYEKMTSAKELGVTGVMESWLFGNYPCLMSKAVGVLSTDRQYASKREFLEELAGLYFNGKDAKKVATAWECFEKGYREYPINVMFNYYGPMHDGIVWELSLLPKNKPLPRTWQLTDKPNGDRIGECLFSGHTLEEALVLSRTVSEKWDKGLQILSTTSIWNDENNEQISVARAIGLLFKSGYNVLRFYKLRDRLGYGTGNAKETLNSMREIVLQEIENSTEMIRLCEKDDRLGYHSEAEGYKFFPEKLKNRIEKLKDLLSQEFSLVEKRIENGLIPLEYYFGKENDVKRVRAGRKGLKDATWAYLDDQKSRFRIAVGEYLEIEIESEGKENFSFCNEYRLMFPGPTMVVKSDGKLVFDLDSAHQSVLDEKVEKELSKWKVTCLTEENTHLILRIKQSETDFIRLPYKFLIRSYNNARWCVDKEPFETLGKWTLSPGDFGWIE